MTKWTKTITAVCMTCGCEIPLDITIPTETSNADGIYRGYCAVCESGAMYGAEGRVS